MKPLDTIITNPNETHSQKLLGLLQAWNCIDDENLKLVSRLQKKSRGRSISSILVDAGVEEEKVQRAVAEIAQVRFESISEEEVSRELVAKLGIGWCREHMVLPVSINGKLFLASTTLDELFLTDDVRSEVGMNVGQMLSTRRDIDAILEKLDNEEAIEHTTALDDFDADFYADEDNDYTTIDLQEEASECRIVTNRSNRRGNDHKSSSRGRVRHSL